MNIAERNSQVAKMADIYKAAQSVLVWLGKADEFTRDAITTIETISAIPEDEWPLVSYTSFYDPSCDEQSRRPNLSFHNWLGFIALMNRPWFKRAWVGASLPGL
jgi:transglutaminase-like putative cysteine protease